MSVRGKGMLCQNSRVDIINSFDCLDSVFIDHKDSMG